ncbi:MAG: helix-turn-helix domain-containing protein [Thermodesulfovibrionia bacterium]|nr:helix-turn-helix domain-containing protein [Thermodesulfovibrionia bacterium]
MKAELENADIEFIASKVAELLKPMLSTNAGNVDIDPIFDVEGLADYLRVSKKWIYERTHLKEIPHIKINGTLRFRKKKIDKWLESYNVPAVDTPSRILKAIK